jgi:hypothetical protein
MTESIPVRLSAALASGARTASRVCDRSLTEQVEHWARLGQVVEAAIAAPTTQHLKALSHDPELADRLAAARTDDGRARAAELIRARNAVLHGVDARGATVRRAGGRRPTRRAKP